MATYRINKLEGYECVLETTVYPEYTQVVFVTTMETPQNHAEVKKQFQMFLAPEDLHRLITALTMTQYDWHQHNTQGNTHERS
jgi:hypothetical protein